MSSYELGMWWSKLFMLVSISYAIVRYVCGRPVPVPVLALTQVLVPASSIVTETTDIRDTCTICIEDFEVGDRIVNLPCAHKFHTKCISPWLKKSTECPNCKNEIKF